VTPEAFIDHCCAPWDVLISLIYPCLQYVMNTQNLLIISQRFGKLTEKGYLTM
jgi:hypothetical protein